MTFDPKQYLAETEAEAFDPAAYLASVSPPSGRERVGGGEAFARHAGQGATAGFGEETVSALQQIPAPLRGLLGPLGAVTNASETLAELTTPNISENLKRGAALVDAERTERMGLGERLRQAVEGYRQGREGERAANARAREDQPLPSFLGNVVGGLPLAIATGGAGAPSLGRAVAQGAGLGGLGGLGGSSADLTQGDVGGAAADTSIGGLLGGAAGAAGAGLAKVLSGPGAELLKRLGIGQARKVLTGGTKSISQAKALTDEAAERALTEGAVRPLGTTAGAAERLAVLRETAGNEYAALVRELEAAGVEGPSAHRLAAEWFLTAKDAASRSLGSSVPGLYRRVAQELAGKYAPGQKVPLGVAEDMKRSLQDAARSEYARVGGHPDIGEAKMALASDMRQAVEDAIAAQAQKAPAKAAAFEPAKRRLSELIQGSEAANKALNSAQNKNSISLRDLLVADAAPTGALGKVALLPLSMAARAFGPSTVAAGSYGLGSALSGGTGKALVPGALSLEQALVELLRQNREEESPSGP
jgi:hypothetical protein